MSLKLIRYNRRQTDKLINQVKQLNQTISDLKYERLCDKKIITTLIELIDGLEQTICTKRRPETYYTTMSCDKINRLLMFRNEYMKSINPTDCCMRMLAKAFIEVDEREELIKLYRGA